MTESIIFQNSWLLIFANVISCPEPMTFEAAEVANFKNWSILNSIKESSTEKGLGREMT
jgi:hypothetical protein